MYYNQLVKVLLAVTKLNAWMVPMFFSSSQNSAEGALTVSKIQFPLV